ncbi:MAG TPA: nuclear transport factor 2 family protein [Longimicrobiales bacterium]|nr:nuclear transport factor 2 family protein [Longimicrobiales bacterium]
MVDVLSQMKQLGVHIHAERFQVRQPPTTIHMNDPSNSPAADRLDVCETFTRMLHAIDAREWQEVRSAFADEVTTDYTQLFGGDVQTQRSDGLIAGWRDFAAAFDATQHLTGPFVVGLADDTARAQCAVTARHRMGEAQWIVGGHYDVRLVRRGSHGWAITAITLRVAFIEGDTSLPERARQRVTGNW